MTYSALEEVEGCMCELERKDRKRVMRDHLSKAAGCVRRLDGCGMEYHLRSAQKAVNGTRRSDDFEYTLGFKLWDKKTGRHFDMSDPDIQSTIQDAVEAMKQYIKENGVASLVFVRYAGNLRGRFKNRSNARRVALANARYAALQRDVEEMNKLMEEACSYKPLSDSEIAYIMRALEEADTSDPKDETRILDMKTVLAGND
jgi:hypothetical protein